MYQLVKDKALKYVAIDPNTLNKDEARIAKIKKDNDPGPDTYTKVATQLDRNMRKKSI